MGHQSRLCLCHSHNSPPCALPHPWGQLSAPQSPSNCFPKADAVKVSVANAVSCYSLEKHRLPLQWLQALYLCKQVIDEVQIEYTAHSGIVVWTEGANKPCCVCKIFPPAAPYSLHTPSRQHLLGVITNTHSVTHLGNVKATRVVYCSKEIILQQRSVSPATSDCEHQTHLGFTW